MDVKDIKKLLDALAGADVGEFSLETGEYKLTLKRGQEQVVVAQAAPVAATLPQATTLPNSEPVTAPAVEPAVKAEQETVSSNLIEVTAPIVGTFYAAASPDAAPFVSVGDRVNPGQVLCIIEAMKLMNEIEAEVSGTIAEVLVRNEDPVEYGQVLFRIEPS